MPEMPVAPTRLVGDIFLGTLGDVMGKVFGMKTESAPFGLDANGQGLTLVPISAQLEQTLPLSAQLNLTLSPL